MRAFTAITLFLILVATLPAQESARVDALFEDWDRGSKPGAAVAVVKEGRLVHQRGYGMANLELGVPITPWSRFYLGSVSKQLVACCVAMLVIEGKIDLTDDIRKHVPEIPDYGTKIEVQNLVHHTSGLRDYLGLMSMAGLPLGHFRSNDGILEMLARQKGLNFAPGEKYSYSNSGYLLLAEIIARVSGKSLRKFAEERIFAPLGMRATRFHDDYEELIPNRASAYFRTRWRGFRSFITTFDRVGSGGVFSTVEDLVLWDRELEDGKVLSPEVRALMHTPGKLAGGAAMDYAFGLVIGTYRGLPKVSHGGSLGGYRSAILRFPEQRFSVIILANVDAMAPMQLCHEIAGIYLASELGEAPEQPEQRRAEPQAGGKPTPAELGAELAGSWWSDELAIGMELEVKNGKLRGRLGTYRGVLRLLGPDHLGDRGVELRIVREEHGSITHLLLDGGGMHGLIFERRE